MSETKPTKSTLRSHPVTTTASSFSSSDPSKPLPPTPKGRRREGGREEKDFYGFQLQHHRRREKTFVDDGGARECLRVWETNELAKCAREISERLRDGTEPSLSMSGGRGDDDVSYVKRWKRAVQKRRGGGQLLAKTVKTFGAPREKRGEIWYELSGARQFEEFARESYERLVERADEEDGREMPTASFSGGRGGRAKQKQTKSEENEEAENDDDDDTTYNARDGSERSQSEKKRAKEEWAMQIDLDVDRTFPENDIFRTHGKEALRRILRAYSRRNPRTGYCQGMNYIAAFIWLAVRNSDSFNASNSNENDNNNSRSGAGDRDDDDDKDDEAIEKTAFWIFTAALDGHALCREIHARDLRGTIREFGVLHSILTWRNRRLSRHLDDIGVDFACCEPRWLVCVYLESFPSETVARIFDSLFANGFKVWHRVAVSQIVKCEKEIMKCQSLPEVAGCIRAQLERSHDAKDVMERAYALRNFRGGKIAQLREKVVQRLDKEREERFANGNRRRF